MKEHHDILYLLNILSMIREYVNEDERRKNNNKIRLDPLKVSDAKNLIEQIKSRLGSSSI